MLPATRIRRVATVVALAAIWALTAACSGTADLIPGDTTIEVTAPAEASPTAVIAPPILAPSSIGVTGARPRTNGVPETIPDTELARSVVQLQLFDISTGFVRLVRDGSGVVIDADERLVLTSYALVNPYEPNGTSAYTSIAVGISRAPGEEPSTTFEAELVAADPLRDIAVLRATRLYRGGAIGPGDFSVPAVLLGDAETLERGDALRILGHPGLESEGGSQAVVSSTATMTGSRGHALITGRAWLRTDARLPYGIAGGPVFDATGALIGVATQLAYDPQAPIGQVRPLSLATEVIATARRAGPLASHRPPLEVPALPTTPRSQGDAIVVGDISFAENAVEGANGLGLFDYTLQFPSEPPALYYEYAAQGVPDGALVEERWFLDGILQDALSSSFNWMGGPFAVIADRLAAPPPRNVPNGRWLLEVWVDGTVRASSVTFVALPPPGEPVLDGLTFASSIDSIAPTPPSSVAEQLLATFDYEGARGATRLRWIVFRDGRVIYQSPEVRWQGGESGTWWIGYSAEGPIGAGFWEFEVYLDSPGQPRPVSRGANGIDLR